MSDADDAPFGLDMMFGLSSATSAHADLDEPVDIETAANQMAFLLSTLPPVPTHFACNARTFGRVREAVPIAAAREPSVYDMPIIVDEAVADGVIEKRYGRIGGGGHE